MDDLKADSALTPYKLASYFQDFGFQFHALVQSPDAFLRNGKGDCDDFGRLAAEILREKGYTTRLVTVRTSKVIHVICYVEEIEAYLDFNDVKPRVRLFPCGRSLPEIAERVARDLGQSWSSASEFSFNDGMKVLVATVVRRGNPAPAFIDRSQNTKNLGTTKELNF